MSSIDETTRRVKPQASGRRRAGVGAPTVQVRHTFAARGWPRPRPGVAYETVNGLKARVRNGRLVVDEPTTLPDGTEIELTVAEAGDELDAEERMALHDALADAWKSAQAGELRPAEELLRKLRTPG